MKHAAAAQMNLNPRLYASNSPPTPASIIWGVTPGTVASAASLLAERSVMKAVREDAGRPRGKTALAIFVPKFAVNLPVKMALSMELN